MVVANTCVPPVNAVYHPLKVYPDWVGAGSVPTAVQTLIVFVAGLTVPPLALNVTTYVLTVVPPPPPPHPHPHPPPPHPPPVVGVGVVGAVGVVGVVGVTGVFTFVLEDF